MTASEAKGAVIRFTVWETEGERREVGHHSYTVAQLLLEAESGDQASEHLFEVVDMEQVYMGEARIEAELLEVDLRPVDESLAIAPGPVPAAGVLQEVMQHSIEAKLSGHGSDASTDYYPFADDANGSRLNSFEIDLGGRAMATVRVQSHGSFPEQHL